MSKLTCFVLFIGLTIGCVSTTVDVLSTFHFDGRVTNEQGLPIEGVRLTFVDTGIDQWRSRGNVSVRVAESDSDGRIASDFPYLWGYRTRGRFRPAQPPPGNYRGTFDLVYSAEGYGSVRVGYNVNDLPTHDGKILVEFEVALEKIEM